MKYIKEYQNANPFNVSNEIPYVTTIEPFLYHTEQDIHNIKEGDVLTLTFSTGKHGRQKTDYLVKYVYNPEPDHIIIGAVLNDKKDNFTEKDVIYITTYDRVDGLMTNLYDENKWEFRGLMRRNVNIH